MIINSFSNRQKVLMLVLGLAFLLLFSIPVQAETPKKDTWSSTDSSSRVVVGWYERVKIFPEGVLVDAKLTPGSEGNVLHAENLKKYKVGKDSWVRFNLPSRKGEAVKIERKIVDKTKFKTTKGGIEERLIVRAGFCLGDKYLEIDFALADRSSYEQEVRIGRDVLAGHFLIDPAKTKSSKPTCPAKKKTKEEVLLESKGEDAVKEAASVLPSQTDSPKQAAKIKAPIEESTEIEELEAELADEEELGEIKEEDREPEGDSESE